MVSLLSPRDLPPSHLVDVHTVSAFTPTPSYRKSLPPTPCPPPCPPSKRMKRFFETLYATLRRGARAVLQIYPENAQQAEMLVAAAMKVGAGGMGFGGGEEGVKGYAACRKGQRPGCAAEGAHDGGQEGAVVEGGRDGCRTSTAQHCSTVPAHGRPQRGSHHVT